MRPLSVVVFELGAAWVLVMLLGEAFAIVVVCLFVAVLVAGVIWPWTALIFRLGRLTARLNPWTVRRPRFPRR